MVSPACLDPQRSSGHTPPAEPWLWQKPVLLKENHSKFTLPSHTFTNIPPPKTANPLTWWSQSPAKTCVESLTDSTCLLERSWLFLVDANNASLFYYHRKEVTCHTLSLDACWDAHSSFVIFAVNTTSCPKQHTTQIWSNIETVLQMLALSTKC